MSTQPLAATKASWAPMCYIGLAQLMVMLDATVVNVALPSIGDDLHADVGSLQWTVSAYVLMYGSLLLFGGRVSDVAGRRRTFLVGLAIFCVASGACGVAPTLGLLICFRALQGAGAALLSAAALSILVSVYQEAGQRKVALTAWSSLGVVGATIGVILGGSMVTALSWRWAFFINVPFCMVAFLGALARVPLLPGVRRRSLRIPSALAVSAGLGLLSYGFIRFDEGIESPYAWACILAALGVLAVVVASELRSSDPLLPLGLLRMRSYVLSSVGLFVAAAVMISGSYLGSQIFQSAFGMSALAAGFSLLPMGLASLIVAFALPSVIGKWGAMNVYFAGAIAQLLGALVLSWEVHSQAEAIACLAVIGAGLPSCFVPLYATGATHVRPEDSGVATGLLNTFNQTGSALGIAVVGTVLATTVQHRLVGGASSSAAAAAGCAKAFIVVAACAGIGLVISLLIRFSRASQ